MRQIIDPILYPQSGGNSEQLTKDVLNVLTKEKPRDEENGINASTEDANSLIDIAKDVSSKGIEFDDDETAEQKTARQEEIKSLNDNMKQIINKYIDDAHPVKTESKVSETNIALSGILSQTTSAFSLAMSQGNAEEKTKLRELMRVIQKILEVTKAVRDMAEARIQALTSDDDDDKCLITGDPREDEALLPGMYPMTEFEDELIKGGFIIRVDTGNDSDKNVCTFEQLIINPSLVRENLCRICFPVVMQTNTNRVYNLQNNSFAASKLRLFLPEGKNGGDSLSIQVYGMKEVEFETKQRQGLIKTPPVNTYEDAIVEIPHYVYANDEEEGPIEAGEAIIKGSKVTFSNIPGVADELIEGIVMEINSKNDTLVVEVAASATLPSPQEIAISEIIPAIVKIEDFKDTNGKTYFMHTLKDSVIGQAATNDIYIKLRAFTEFGGIISLEELYLYVVQASKLRMKKGSSFRNPLKLVAVPDMEDQPIASFKLTSSSKVGKYIDDIIYGTMQKGTMINKILAPVRASKTFLNTPESEQVDVMLQIRNSIIGSTDKVIEYENKNATYSQRMPTLSKYMETFSVVSASHCQDGQIERLYKIELSQEQQDEWDAYRGVSDRLEMMNDKKRDITGQLRDLAKQIRAAGDDEKTDLIKNQKNLNTESQILTEDIKQEKKRISDNRKSLEKMFLEDGGRKLAKNAGPKLSEYENYKNELTLPNAEKYYKDLIIETVKQLTNNSPDYEYRGVEYDSLMAALFCIPDYPRDSDGNCQQLPTETGPLRLFASWLANQFLCLKPDPDRPGQPPGRYYRPEDNDETIKQVLDALVNFGIIKERSFKRIKGPFDNDYVFADDYKYLNDNWVDPIGVFVDGEADSLGHEVVNEPDEYIKNILKKNYVTFTPNEPITTENCARIVADPKNYTLSELDGMIQSEDQMPRDFEVLNPDGNCPVLGQDIQSGVQLPASFDNDACTDLMCEVYRRYIDILTNMTINDDPMPESMTDEVMTIMIESGRVSWWVRHIINGDPELVDPEVVDTAMEELKKMVNHIVECMEQGTQCRYDDVIKNTCVNSQDLPRVLNFGDDEPVSWHPDGHCDAIKNPFDVSSEASHVVLPSTWTEENCGDLICAVREEYDSILNKITDAESENMTMNQWVARVKGSWSELGEFDPTERYLNLIKQAPEITDDAGAIQMLDKMIGSVLECLLEPEECSSYNHMRSIPCNDDNEDSFDAVAANVASDMPEGQGPLGSLSPINSQNSDDWPDLVPPGTPPSLQQRFPSMSPRTPPTA